MDIKIGDIVNARGIGGPRMLVVDINGDNVDGTWWCTNTGTFCRNTFPAGALQVVGGEHLHGAHESTIMRLLRAAESWPKPDLSEFGEVGEVCGVSLRHMEVEVEPEDAFRDANVVDESSTIWVMEVHYRCTGLANEVSVRREYDGSLTWDDVAGRIIGAKDMRLEWNDVDGLRPEGARGRDRVGVVSRGGTVVWDAKR